MVRAGIALLVLLLLVPVGCERTRQAADPGGPARLVFSAIPDQDETRLREKFQPVADYLAQRLRVPVVYHHCTSYDDAVELFRNGDVQLAWLGGLTGVQAWTTVPGARAIAMGAEDPQFYSYFIAHRNAGLTRSDAFPTDLAGKSFLFGAKKSTSGRLMPEYFIRKHTGKAPAEVCGAIEYSGDHDQTCELVESGQFQVGAVNYQVYDRRVKEGQTDPAVCRIVWQTPAYPDYNFTAHPDLERMFGEGFTDRLRAALVDMKDPRLLGAFGRNALIPAENQQFAAVAEIARQLGFVR